jgi:kynureninase
LSVKRKPILPSTPSADDIKGHFPMQPGEVLDSTFQANKEAWSAGLGMSWTPAPWVTMELSAGAPLKRLVANQPDHAIYYSLSFRLL